MSDVGTAKFRIDVAIHDLLMHAVPSPPAPPEPAGLTLPDPVSPQFPEALNDAGPVIPPERRQWSAGKIYRTARGWLFPYVKSRVLPGEFHPITAYLFVEYKCNLDCWYCWAYNNKVKGMSGGQLGGFIPVDREKVFEIVETLEEIAKAKGAPIAAVALAWVAAKRWVSSVILGAECLCGAICLGNGGSDGCRYARHGHIGAIEAVGMQVAELTPGMGLCWAQFHAASKCDETLTGDT